MVPAAKDMLNEGTALCVNTSPLSGPRIPHDINMKEDALGPWSRNVKWRLTISQVWTVT